MVHPPAMVLSCRGRLQADIASKPHAPLRSPVPRPHVFASTSSEPDNPDRHTPCRANTCRPALLTSVADNRDSRISAPSQRERPCVVRVRQWSACRWAENPRGSALPYPAVTAADTADGARNARDPVRLPTPSGWAARPPRSVRPPNCHPDTRPIALPEAVKSRRKIDLSSPEC